MNRAWDEWVAAVFDVVPGRYVLLILLVGAGLAGALWYWFPAWVPRRLPRWRWRWPRRRRPRVKKARAPKPARKPKAKPEKNPEPVVAEAGLADRYAAEGRYAEAIRERLRETVGELAAAGVVTPEPGETATEVAASASARRPALTTPLAGATDLFSEVWYGDRPAGAAQDEHMRALSGEVHARLRDGAQK